MNPKYGMIKGKLHGYETENDFVENVNKKKKYTPHYNFELDCNGVIYNVNINVLSRDPDSPDLKVYYSENPESDLNNLGALCSAKTIDNGVYKDLQESMAIDYLRGGYIELSKLIVLAKNKALEELFLFYMIDKHMRIAKENNYDICVWGELYDNSPSNDKYPLGIHDVHMNQGNPNGKDNATWSDGIFAIYDGDELKFVCFLSFSGQCTQTDDEGNCF